MTCSEHVTYIDRQIISLCHLCDKIRNRVPCSYAFLAILSKFGRASKTDELPLSHNQEAATHSLEISLIQPNAR